MNVNVVKKHGMELYCIGNISLLDDKIVAVIGKRDVSDDILNSAYNIGKGLTRKGIAVLNGLAIGCDKSVIEGVLSEHGKAIAVLPCGGRCYLSKVM